MEYKGVFLFNQNLCASAFASDYANFLNVKCSLGLKSGVVLPTLDLYCYSHNHS